MKYDPIRKVFIIPVGEMDGVALYLRYALGCIRETAGLPMDKYEETDTNTPADSAQDHILAAARTLGLDFGTRHAHELDLREEWD